MDLTVVAEALGMEVRDLTWRRDPKLMKHKPADPGRKPRLRAKARVSDDRQGKQKPCPDLPVPRSLNSTRSFLVIHSLRPSNL